MRSHVLPEMLPGEANEDWCRRAAESIPAEELMRLLVRHLDRRQKQRKQSVWSFIGDMTGHGSGVSGAIVRRFRYTP